MKILVTGGAGFIGSAVVRFLINQTNNEVLNVDSLTYAGNLKNVEIASSSRRYNFIKVDLCDLQALKKAFDFFKPQSIIHLAAESHVDRSIYAPSGFIWTNIIGTYNLLETTREYLSAIDKKYVEKFRFLHVSTDEVYGDLPHPNYQLDADKYSFKEASPYAPNSPYAASKASSDHLVRSWGHTYGLSTLISNCSNNYGEYQYPEKFIPKMILSATRGERLPIFGNGENIRDWLYVEDHVEALYLILKKGQPGASYNIGGNSEFQNIEVARLICHILDEICSTKPDGISNYFELAEFVTDRAGHDKRYAMDTQKLTDELGWEPKHSFENGLRKTVAWYLKNGHWLEQLT